MQAMINIGNTLDMKEAAPAVADAVVQVLNAIGANRIDREVAIQALQVVGQTAAGPPVSISDCSLVNKLAKGS